MESTLKKIAIIMFLFALTPLAWSGDEEEEPVKISYVEMKPSFVTNLTGGPKYIRCDIQLMTKFESKVETIQTHMPALRHAILMLLAGEDGKQLLTPEGKESLRKKALDTVQKTLEELADEPMVEDLYFTAYYVK